jgi:hypothetical protein
MRWMAALSCRCRHGPAGAGRCVPSWPGSARRRRAWQCRPRSGTGPPRRSRPGAWPRSGPHTPESSAGSGKPYHPRPQVAGELVDARSQHPDRGGELPADADWNDAGTAASQAAMRSSDAPGSRWAACSSSGSSWCRCQRSRLIVLVRSAMRCSRWSTSSLTSHKTGSWPAVGRSGSHGRRPGDGQCGDRSDLPNARTAALAPAINQGCAGSGHQPGRDGHDLLAGGQQIAFQPAGDVAAVLYRPQAMVSPVPSCPAKQFGMALCAR